MFLGISTPLVSIIFTKNLKHIQFKTGFDYLFREPKSV
jgi:hypothetical protein